MNKIRNHRKIFTVFLLDLLLFLAGVISCGEFFIYSVRPVIIGMLHFGARDKNLLEKYEKRLDNAPKRGYNINAGTKLNLKAPKRNNSQEERNSMKFKKIKNVAFFSKYIREDGKYTIESTDRYINGTLKNVFVVTDESGNEIDVLSRLKDAKAKYSE